MSFLVLKYKKSGKNRGKAVIVISKKVSKKATARNKLKRQIRAVIRQQAKEKNIREEGITVIVSPEIVKKSFKQIEHEISRFMPN